MSEHTVEVTVNRLRTKLGRAAVALETSNRRGYRLAMRMGWFPSSGSESSQWPRGRCAETVDPRFTVGQRPGNRRRKSRGMALPLLDP